MILEFPDASLRCTILKVCIDAASINAHYPSAAVQKDSV